MNACPQLLHDLLAQAAQRLPDAPAVSDTATTVSYRQLYERSLRLSLWLRRQGVRRGDRMVVSAPGSTTLVALLYAAGRLGAAFVVLHEQVGARPLAHVLDDCTPALVITDDEANRAVAHERGIPAVGTAAIVAAATAFAEAPIPYAGGPLAVDPVCLIYTSGTTSRPKAVVSTHQQVIFAASAIQEVLRYRSDDVVYCPLPLSFDYGLYQVFLSTIAGAHLVIGRPAEVGPPLLRNLVSRKATVLPAVPTVADALARLLRRRDTGRPPLRLLTNTGAVMPTNTVTELRAAIPGLSVQLMYGLTECKRVAVMPPNEDMRRPGACGRALPGTEVTVRGDAGEPLPAGEIGEFVVRGPHVMAGYWHRPDATAERFPLRDGLFAELRTGDYGWLDDDGYLYFVGRRDDIYKERGFRVSATEVEAAARRLPGVRSAAVLPPGDGRASVLFVVTDHDDAERVRAAMREEIEEFKIPAHCVRLDRLPLTGNGKVDRKALAASLREVRHAG